MNKQGCGLARKGYGNGVIVTNYGQWPIIKESNVTLTPHELQTGHNNVRAKYPL